RTRRPRRTTPRSSSPTSRLRSCRKRRSRPWPWPARRCRVRRASAESRADGRRTVHGADRPRGRTGARDPVRRPAARRCGCDPYPQRAGGARPVGARARAPRPRRGAGPPRSGADARSRGPRRRGAAADRALRPGARHAPGGAAILREMAPLAVPSRPTSQEAIGALLRVEDNVARVIRGKPEAIRLAVTTLLARGHLLIEDVPGVGKTPLGRALARSLGGTFRRIQFTSDLLPSDILGVSVYDQAESRFEFRPGPLFANVVLADEINR